MDRTLRLAPLLVVALLALATPPATALKKAGPCFDERIPPHFQAGGCGPAVGVQLTLRFKSSEGTKEYTFGSCDGNCDLRVIIDVIVCRSRAAVAEGETEIEGEMRVVDRHGVLLQSSTHQTIHAKIALIPWCLEDDVG